MADQDFLPRRPFAVLPPEPGGFESALARGRRRRRRTTGGGVLASVLVVALAMNLAGSSPDSAARLEFNERIPNEIVDDPRLPAPGQVEADQPDAEAEAELETNTPAGTTGGVARSSSGTSDARAAAPVAQPSTTAKPPATQPRTRSTAWRPTPPEETTVRDGYVDCLASNGLEVDQWCLQAMHQVTDDKKGDAALTLKICLSDYATVGVDLKFPTEQQVDYEITREGSDEVLWQWAFRAEFDERPTSDRVAAGDCRAYSVIWPQGNTDSHGNTIRVTPSDPPFVLTAKTLASNEELSGSNTARYTIPKEA